MIATALTAWAGLAGANAAAPGQSPEEYAWAAACKDCHAEIYASWEKSKHARAFGHQARDQALRR